MMPSEFFKKKEQELKDHKSRAYPKIANSFIENVIANSNENALKIVWYLSMSMKDVSIDETKRDIKTYTLDEKDIVKETGLDVRTILKYLKTMQKTTVTFIDENEKYEEHIQLIPRIKNNHDGTIDYDVYDVVAKLIMNVADKTSGTYVDVRRLLNLENKHSIRLLPLLEKILTNNGNTKKQKTCNLDYLNSLFGTSYKRYSYVISKILKPVQEELDSNSTLTFTFKTNRETLGKAGKPPIVSITITPIANNNYQTSLDSMMLEQEKYDKKNIVVKENILSPQVPTQSDIEYAIDELQITPNEAEQKYKMFLEWEQKIGKKRSFQKYLLDGKEKGL